MNRTPASAQRRSAWLVAAAVLVAFALGFATGGLVTAEEACGEVRAAYETLIRKAADAAVDEGRVHVTEGRAIALDRSDCFTAEELRSLPRPPPG